MSDVWNPVSFTAGPLGIYEAVYLEDDGQFTRYPIIGVLIQEKFEKGPSGFLEASGITRSVMAKQLEPGSADVEAAGGGGACVGVFEVGQAPTEELLQSARTRMAEAAEDYKAHLEDLAAYEKSRPATETT